MRSQLIQTDAEKGTTRFYKGQAYRCEGPEFIEYPNGGWRTVFRWSSACPVCDARFDFTTPFEQTEVYPIRRCKDHRKPGSPV